MALDTVNGRIKLKRDTTANWNAATGFVPLEGEVIIYTDYQVTQKEVNNYDPEANPIEQGAISSSNGADTTSGTRVRTNGYVTVSPSTEYTVSTNMARVFVLYYRYGSYMNQYSGWQNAPYTFTVPTGANQIRVVLDNNNASVTPSDFEWMRIVDPTQTVTTTIPGIKIGSGNAYVQDLAFIDEDTRKTLAEHIDDWDVHVTTADRTFWNNKVTTVDSVVDETLIFTRS